MPETHLALDASEGNTLRYVRRSTLENCIIHRRESGEADFDYRSFSYQANQRDQLPWTDSSATTQSWANGTWYQNRSIVASSSMAEDTHMTHGTHESTKNFDGYYHTTEELRTDKDFFIIVQLLMENRSSRIKKFVGPAIYCKP